MSAVECYCLYAPVKVIQLILRQSVVGKTRVSLENQNLPGMVKKTSVLRKQHPLGMVEKTRVPRKPQLPQMVEKIKVHLENHICR